MFSSLEANNYNYIIATEPFLNSTPVYNGTVKDVQVTSGIISTMNQKALTGSLVKYEPLDCQNAYSEAFVSKFQNVVLITADKNGTNNVLGGRLASIRDYNGFNDIPYTWVCGDGYTKSPWSTYVDYTIYGEECTKSTAANFTQTNGWKLFGYQISYCMVEEVVEHCSLSFSLPIMITVITANVLKFSVMLLTVWKLRNRPLVTIGDAVASFLEVPDLTTINQCLSSKGDMARGDWPCYGAKLWTTQRQFWFKAASGTRWLTCNLLYASFQYIKFLADRLQLYYLCTDRDTDARPRSSQYWYFQFEDDLPDGLWNHQSEITAERYLPRVAQYRYCCKPPASNLVFPLHDL